MGLAHLRSAISLLEVSGEHELRYVQGADCIAGASAEGGAAALGVLASGATGPERLALTGEPLASSRFQQADLTRTSHSVDVRAVIVPSHPEQRCLLVPNPAHPTTPRQAGLESRPVRCAGRLMFSEQ